MLYFYQSQIQRLLDKDLQKKLNGYLEDTRVEGQVHVKWDLFSHLCS